MTKRLLRRIELSSLDYYTHIYDTLYPSKMTKLFSKLNLTDLFYIIYYISTTGSGNYHTTRKLPQSYYFQLSTEVYLKLREGISQIVKCVGVETPHCGNVEMWWIHIVKMWRCGGSTFLAWRSTLILNLSKN